MGVAERRRSAFSLWVAAMVGLGGCGTQGSDCEELCEDSKDCEALGAGETLDCEDECEESAALAAKSGCSAQTDAAIECVADNFEQVCEHARATECDPEMEALIACVTDFCEANPAECVE